MAEEQPLVWCLLGRKAGDNTQVLALAEELGWPCEHKQVRARPWELLVHLGSAATLAGIDRQAGSPLVPPWPDLVISAGRRNEPVARWIAAQNRNACRLVHMGRPWAALDRWDLLVTTPQYFLPRQPNVQHNELPLHNLQPVDLAADGEALRARLGDLPGPYTVLLVGGDSGRFVFTAEKGRRLAQAGNELLRQRGGSLLVSNSSRTPDATYQALLESLEAPHFAYHWQREADDNPYRGLLALGDAFIVTGESMSMLAEANAMGKPLYIFDMGDGSRPWWSLPHNYRYKPLSHHLAMALGPRRMRRDVGRIQQALVDHGHAAWLGDPPPVGAAVNQTELVATAQRVRELMGRGGATAG